MSKTAVK